MKELYQQVYLFDHYVDIVILCLACYYRMDTFEVTPISAKVKRMSFRSIRWICISILIIPFLLGGRVSRVMSQSATEPGLNCRFGITSPISPEGIDLRSLGIGAFLNWNVVGSVTLPEGIEYINVLRLGDRCFDKNDDEVDCTTLSDPRPPYQKTLDMIKTLVPAHPGMYWIVGNEPDTEYDTQDDLNAEEYANRFFQVATRIRSLDPTARIGFGSIVQPTYIRLKYLDAAWQKLVSLAGDQVSASHLIDFWAIHSFILNEFPNEWGTGLPPGFEASIDDSLQFSDFAITHSISFLTVRLRSFRRWMNDHGERDKPLWITEYGSLLPPQDPPGGPDLENVSDEETRDFMLQSFDLMLNASDTDTGLPTDNNHLVQRWFWYSLNDYRWNFGGSLYDPSSNPPAATILAKSFISYAPKNKVDPEFHFVGKATMQQEGTNPLKYSINFELSNAGSSIRQSPKIWIFQNSPQGALVGEKIVEAV
ncbi:MAG TPA: hypothetical protein VF338_10310, partial [Leptolinea sp.]